MMPQIPKTGKTCFKPGKLAQNWRNMFQTGKTCSKPEKLASNRENLLKTGKTCFKPGIKGAR